METVDVVQLLEDFGVDLSTINAWVPGYFPFVMGGHTWQAMTAELPCGKPIDVGKGFYCVLIPGPDGTSAVAEATTGAVVGHTLDKVRADIAACDDIKYMRSQVKAAEAWRTEHGSTTVEPEEWWRRRNKN